MLGQALDSGSIIDSKQDSPVHFRISCSSISKKRQPSALAIPKPASLVALPPTPTKHSLTFSCPSVNKSFPTPQVSKSKGWNSPFGNKDKPLDSAASTTALPHVESTQYGTSQSLLAASHPRKDRSDKSNSLAMTTPKPSPPSDIGNICTISFGQTLIHPEAMALATFIASREPLNLSGTMSIRRAIIQKIFAK